MNRANGDTSFDTFDKLPPHSIDAEMCVLASMMLDKDAIDNAVMVVDREMFYLPDHQVLFDTIIELQKANRSVDAVIIREELIKRGKLEEIGGTEYLMQVLNSVPSAAHCEHYAGIVRDKAILRRLISASNDTLRETYAPHEDVNVLLQRAEGRIFDIAEKKAGDLSHLGAVAMEVYDMIEGHQAQGIMTDFRDLDDMLNGLQKDQMIIVAARPSMGKTAFAMNIVQQVAMQNVPCAVFSLEMSKQQLAQRMMVSAANIDGHRVRKGMLRNEEYHALAQVVNQLSQLPIWVDDSPGLTIMDLRAKCRRLKRQHDIQLIMIDYLQLMDNPGVESRQQQISEISRGIKAVARDLRVPVIALSQLNRSSENRDGHRPRMSDLRESGSIEQDADVVMLLHREDYYRQTDPDFVPDNIAEVIVAKQRNGPTGTVKLTWDSKCATFKNLAVPIDAI
jgi:replicative DNA helicase